MELCEHGHTFNCLQCEVKNLNYVIQELLEQNEQLNHRIPREIEDGLRRTIERYEKALQKIAFESCDYPATTASAALITNSPYK